MLIAVNYFQKLGLMINLIRVVIWFFSLGVFGVAFASSISTQSIRVDGADICYQIAGRGVPVIFDSGLGDSLSVWNKVVVPIAQTAKTVTYDRVGIGCSTAIKREKITTSAQSVKLLHDFLLKANIEPPYILVGHSLGGLNMQLFAAEYPSEVKGVILIDSISMKQTMFDPLPPIKSFYYPEAIGIKESISEVRNAAPFPSVPLTIITATSHPGFKSFEPLWQKWQKDMLLLSPYSHQIVAKGSHHAIQEDDPKVVVKSIELMLNPKNRSWAR